MSSSVNSAAKSSTGKGWFIKPLEKPGKEKIIWNGTFWILSVWLFRSITLRILKCNKSGKGVMIMNLYWRNDRNYDTPRHCKVSNVQVFKAVQLVTRICIVNFILFFSSQQLLKTFHNRFHAIKCLVGANKDTAIAMKNQVLTILFFSFF